MDVDQKKMKGRSLNDPVTSEAIDEILDTGYLVADESSDVPDRAWEAPKPDPVNHPPHYTRGKYEHVDVVENWEMSPHMKDATKYLMRTTKGNVLVDTQKCRWYICRMIERPWTVLATYDLIVSLPHHYPVEVIAKDWFPDEESNRRKAMIHLGLACLSSPTLEAVMQQLLAAREFVDKELEILQTDGE